MAAIKVGSRLSVRGAPGVGVVPGRDREVVDCWSREVSCSKIEDGARSPANGTCSDLEAGGRVALRVEESSGFESWGVRRLRSQLNRERDWHICGIGWMEGEDCRMNARMVSQ